MVLHIHVKVVTKKIRWQASAVKTTLDAATSGSIRLWIGTCVRYGAAGERLSENVFEVVDHSGQTSFRPQSKTATANLAITEYGHIE